MTLTRAELLKLVRRRALMAWAAILTLGSVLVPYSVLVVLHALNPDHYGPAGGAESLRNAVGVLATVGGVSAVLVAATAGSQDQASGVFRDLVATGRSRASLFLARVRGALVVFLPLVTAAFAIAVAASYGFAGGEATASASDVVSYGEWLLAAAIVNVVVGVSLSSIVGSRITIGVLIAWNAIVAPLLVQLDALGAARAAIGTAAAAHFAPPADGAVVVAMSTATALLVLALWVVVPILAGAHVTKRRDA